MSLSASTSSSWSRTFVFVAGAQCIGQGRRKMCSDLSVQPTTIARNSVVARGPQNAQNAHIPDSVHPSRCRSRLETWACACKPKGSARTLRIGQSTCRHASKVCIFKKERTHVSICISPRALHFGRHTRIFSSRAAATQSVDLPEEGEALLLGPAVCPCNIATANATGRR